MASVFRRFPSDDISWYYPDVDESDGGPLFFPDDNSEHAWEIGEDFWEVPGGITGAGNIVSGETFGSPGLTPNLTIAGIASAEAFGTPVVSVSVLLTNVGGIAGIEAFGTPLASVTVLTAAISGAEAFGSPVVSPYILLTSAGNLLSGEVIGTAALTAVVVPAGAASDELFGTPLVGVIHEIVPTGILATAAFGEPIVTVPYPIMPYGMLSDEAFGTPQVEIRYVITGVVRDRAGNPVPGADVNLFNTATHVLVHNGVTDSTGRYTVLLEDNYTNHFMVAFYGSNPRRAGCTLDNLKGK